jgi:predicted ester cyclase
MDDVAPQSLDTVFHWTLTGTNSGLGGTGKRVRFSGYEVWQIGADGLISDSEGHFDAAEYERQLEHGTGG